MDYGTVSYTLTSSALRNLRLATSDRINRPNRCAVQVYTAIELVLKARLAEEHWSLIVARDPDCAKFEQGDFVSVTFEEACSRLRKSLEILFLRI